MHHTALAIGYLIISALLAGIWAMSFYELQLRGYWTKKVIGWLWLAYTVVCIRVFWRRVVLKIYLAFLSSLLLLSLMAMGIPLFAFVHFISTTGDYQKITLNDTYRLKLTHHLRCA